MALRGQRDVVINAQRCVDLGDLEGIGDAAPDAGMGGQPGDVAAFEKDAPRPGLDPARQEADKGRLARPVRPDQRVNLPRCQIEIDPVHGFQPAEMPRQPARLKDHGSHRSPRSLSVPRMPFGANSTSTTSTAPTMN